MKPSPIFTFSDMNLATFLTIFRILRVPIFVLLILEGENNKALGVFVVAGGTDLLDGWIARRFKQQSSLGTALDPLADKFLLVSSLLVLTWPGETTLARIPAWLTIVAISRDLLLIAGAVAVNWLKGIHTFPPSLGGKWATLFQLMSVFSVLLINTGSNFPVPAGPIFVMTLALTVISGLHYLTRALHLGDFTGKRS